MLKKWRVDSIVDILRVVALNLLSAQLIGLCSSSCRFASGECDAGVDCCCTVSFHSIISFHIVIPTKHVPDLKIGQERGPFRAVELHFAALI